MSILEAIAPQNETTARPLRPHQEQAVKDVVDALRHNERSMLVSACGTGKTVTLHGILQARQDKLAAAFFPSLFLVSQTIKEWRRQYDGQWEQPVAVCSDETVDKKSDEIATSTDDLRGEQARVTGSAEELAGIIRDYRERRDAGLTSLPLVIFSTYQSSDVVAQAQDILAGTFGETVPFDIAILDEAHRAGAGTALGRYVLDGERIRARNRVAATATPVVIHATSKSKGTADTEVNMNVGEHFGQVGHELSIAAARDTWIDDPEHGRHRLIMPYDIQILDIREQGLDRIQRAIMRADLADSVKDPDQRLSLGVAALGVMREEYGVKNALVYVSNRNRARAFANIAGASGFRNVDVITGDMPVADRNVKLDKLRTPEGAVIANVRCLTEGIDVPTIDAVLFVDPRDAKVDVVQALGRAIRWAPDKERGYVFLPPLHAPVPDDTDEKAQQKAVNSQFGSMWNVLAQIAKNDTGLHTWLMRDATARTREAVKSVGEALETVADEGDAASAGEPASTGGSRPADEPEYRIDDSTPHVQVAVVDDLPWMSDEGDLDVKPAIAHDIDTVSTLSKIREHIAVRTVDLLGSDTHWENRAREFGAFHAREGRRPSKRSGDATEKGLGEWLGTQRAQARNEGLRSDRRAYLDEVAPGWTGQDLDEQWNERAREVGAFHREEGRLPSTTSHDAAEKRLGRWLNRQRYRPRDEGLRSDRRAHLDEVAPGWTGQDLDEQWNERAREVGAFHREEGRLPSTTSHDSSEKRLGIWLSNRRHQARKKSLQADRHAYLDEVAPGWMGQDRDEQWRECARDLGEFHSRERRWPSTTSDDAAEKRHGQWLSGQHTHSRNGTLSTDRHAYLDEVAPGWNQSRDERWNENAREVGEFHSRERRWPSTTSDDAAEKRLGGWLHTQRAATRNGTIRADRRDYLDEVVPGWLPDA